MAGDEDNNNATGTRVFGISPHEHSKSQVSNWFIHARVRPWKPMVEEMAVKLPPRFYFIEVEVCWRVGQPVNARKLAFTNVMHVMTTMFCGSRLEEAHREELMELVGAIVDLLIVLNVSDLFPAVAWLDLQLLVRQMQKG